MCPAMKSSISRWRRVSGIVAPEWKPKRNLPEYCPNASVPRTTLEAILAVTRARVAALHGSAAALERLAAAAPAARPFPGPLGGTVGVIAEVKRRSPSRGSIRDDLDPVAHARAYVRGGAVAVSVLTEGAHFGGSLDDLAAVAGAVQVPVLRKDFILDELQLLEARAAGASAVLLIVRALPADRLAALARAARRQGLATLVEVHGDAELATALAAEPTAIGVNARDLATFAVDLRMAERVLAQVPPGLPAVAESGIEARSDVERLAAAGADLVLVGTSVTRTADPAAAVGALCGVRRRARG
jgi:indole-3-glycerol phosphate synthase